MGCFCLGKQKIEKKSLQSYKSHLFKDDIFTWIVLPEVVIMANN